MRIEPQIAPAPALLKPRSVGESLSTPRLDPIAGLIAALTHPHLFRIVETADGLMVEPVEAPLM